MVKREKLEIIKDILNIIHENRNSIKITPLIRKSNISTSRFKEYYLELTQKGLIKEISSHDGKFISLTEKGSKFLEKYRTIVDFIDEFEL
jgi:predicted transcriptional regulator